MSDTDRPALTTSAHMYLHYCEETDCNEWGSWGNSPSSAGSTRWWCFEHYPHKSYEQEQVLRLKLEAAEHGADIQ
ncbi:hypothetical protein [Rhizobium redzepovicii]|uniref:hypothetical protein n=1 Tax=Rhizobium redzepovicii TaxID=2867518 RepID=UPI0035C6B568